MESCTRHTANEIAPIRTRIWVTTIWTISGRCWRRTSGTEPINRVREKATTFFALLEENARFEALVVRLSSIIIKSIADRK